ncbi:MAG: SEC-C domain-containing protein, partial [Burkholderiales bacterium]|nr:SEC-C domain-containing protein [Burkholderiales bacterium]
PGSSRFYLSLEDNLMRIFAADWVQRVMARMGLKEDDIIESPLVSKQIANAQRKVEAHNFDIRKNLLDFDDVNNDQRKVIYGQRDELLEADSVQENIDGIRGDVVAELVERFVPPESIDDQWDLQGLEASMDQEFGLRLDLQGLVRGRKELDAEGIQDHVRESLDKVFADKEAQVGPETMRMLEKHIMLNVLDENWKQHLGRMDYLRQGIHLRGYAQKQPKQEYKREAFELFGAMLDSIKRQVTQHMMAVQIRSQAEVEEAERRAEEAAQAVRNVQYHHADPDQALAQSAAEGAEAGEAVAAAEEPAQPFVRSSQKIGRNDPCPCGSGKKYKNCHGKLA